MSFSPENTGAMPPTKADLGLPSEDERMWAMIAHLSFLAGSLVGGLTFIGPLVVWVLKKDESAFVADQAKEALNFQIAVLIATVVTAVTCLLIPLTVVIAIGGLVYGIIAALEANKGVWYRYPYTFRLIK